MAVTEAVTNQIMILGGGLEPMSPNQLDFRLSNHSSERADAAATYYLRHVATFAGEGSMILCTGGASPIYDKLHDVPKNQAEGTLLADRLMHEWDIPSSIIETETQSDTSTTNLINSIEAGLLNPADYDTEHPLGVVTHRYHYHRFQADLKNAGFRLDATFGIHPLNSDSALKELIARGIRASFFMGVQTGDLAAMRRRNRLVTRIFGR